MYFNVNSLAVSSMATTCGASGSSLVDSADPYTSLLVNYNSSHRKIANKLLLVLDQQRTDEIIQLQHHRPKQFYCNLISNEKYYYD